MPRGIQWPLNHLSSHKNNYIFIYFGMPLKMDDISVFFIFIFIQIDISCMCNYKSFCSCLRDYQLFYQVPQRRVVSKVTKMVDFDRSRKCMGWNEFLVMIMGSLSSPFIEWIMTLIPQNLTIMPSFNSFNESK